MESISSFLDVSVHLYVFIIRGGKHALKTLDLNLTNPACGLQLLTANSFHGRLPSCFRACNNCPLCALTLSVRHVFQEEVPFIIS